MSKGGIVEVGELFSQPGDLGKEHFFELRMPTRVTEVCRLGSALGDRDSKICKRTRRNCFSRAGVALMASCRERREGDEEAEGCPSEEKAPGQGYALH